MNKMNIVRMPFHKMIAINNPFVSVIR